MPNPDENTTADREGVASRALFAIGERLRSQDNRCTAEPMFCVQVLRRDYGYDYNWSDEKCWMLDGEPSDAYTDGAEEVHYKERWETVMVAFTEEGCKEHLRLNGHNYHGETRIYAMSFHRCPEMIAIRAFLMANTQAHGTAGGENQPKTH